MSVGLLVIAHNHIGNTMLETAVSLLGFCPLNVEVLPIYHDSDRDDALSKARQFAEKLDQGDGVLVLTDLYGSTPCNIANALPAANNLAKNNLIVIAGMNLPMLIRILNYPGLTLPEMVHKTMNGGKDGILVCQHGTVQ
jgi:PTS system mannose-specific IIA component